jgi:hypothetical protein
MRGEDRMPHVMLVEILGLAPVLRRVESGGWLHSWSVRHGMHRGSSCAVLSGWKCCLQIEPGSVPTLPHRAPRLHQTLIMHAPSPASGLFCARAACDLQEARPTGSQVQALSLSCSVPSNQRTTRTSHWACLRQAGRSPQGSDVTGTPLRPRERQRWLAHVCCTCPCASHCT